MTQPPPDDPAAAASQPPSAPPVAPDWSGQPAYGQPAYGQPPYSAPPGMYVDPGSGVVLPQGVQLASVGRRIGAYFLGVLLMIVTLVIGYIVWGLVIWSRGQTPALQVLGMRCWVPENNQVAGFWRMALRDIIGRIAESVVGLITGVVSFVLFLATRDHKALHDLIASTVVVHDPNKVLG